MRINGFEQIKAFYSWSFSNQDKNIKPQHMSLYLFLINQNNRNNWVEWFKLPFDLAMAGSCISSKRTYYSCLTDLQDWGLIKYQKGVNNWKAPLIKLEVLKDTSTVPQSEPQVEQLPEQASTPQHIQALIQAAEPQPIPNIKLLTSNLKLITSNHKRLTNIIDFAKKQNLIDENNSGISVYSECMKIYNNFILEKTGVSAKIDGQQGKALKAIISYLNKQIKEKTDENLIEAFKVVMDNYEKWDPFHRDQLTLSQINSNFINIINSIKNGKATLKPQSKIESNLSAIKKSLEKFN